MRKRRGRLRLRPLTAALDEVEAVAAHTGWLTGVYTFGLVVCAPLWGALSDRIDRRWVLGGGLFAAGIALLALETAASLETLYASRVLAGAVSAAVLPTILAYVVDTTVPARRQRRFAWISSASALGFLLGSVSNSSVTGAWGAWGLGVVASLCAMAALLAFSLQRPGVSQAHAESSNPSPRGPTFPIWDSFVLTGTVVLGITVAEVGLTLLLRNVAIYFGICSAVMVLTQLLAYPALERKFGERRLVVAALAGMASGLFLLALPATWTPAVAFVLAAAAIGILLPALAVRISLAARGNQGWAMGRQASAANVGQAIGAASTGALFSVAASLPFLFAAIIVAAGCLLAARRTAAMR